MAAKPFAWSYSAVSGFEDCPWRHYLTKVAKTVVEQESPQMREGNQVHKALELRVTEGRPLPLNMSQYEPIAASLLRKAEGHIIYAEQKHALNKNLEPTTFFAKDVWVRVIADVTILSRSGREGFIFDYKTGKPQPASAQLALCAADAFARYGQLETVSTAFLWLRTGKTTPVTYTRADVPAIWQGLLPRVRRLELAHETGQWPKRPSGLCRQYCPVGKANCEHCGS